MFVNHPGGTWSTAEMQAAAGQAQVAKQFYVAQPPGGAELHFDNESGSGYWCFNPSAPYDINGTSEDWVEDALANARGTEQMTIHLTTDDWYGLVYNQNGEGGSYKIRLLDPELAGIQEASPPRQVCVCCQPIRSRAIARCESRCPHAAEGSLAIYDVEGRVVRTLVDGVLAPGVRRIVWDGADDRSSPVASGVYFARLRHGGGEIRLKLGRSQ
jgi:hypothetical protein